MYNLGFAISKIQEYLQNVCPCQAGHRGLLRTKKVSQSSKSLLAIYPQASVAQCGQVKRFNS